MRHASHAEVGHVLSGRSEIGLSEQGAEEARGLGNLLSARHIDVVHASPRRRVQETAAIALPGVATKTIAALDEIDFGLWMGQPFEALDGDPAWATWNTQRGSAAAPAGETMTQATARAVAHIDAAAQEGGGDLVCVTHCDIIRGVVAHYLGLPLDYLLRFDVDPASITELVVGSRGGRLVSLNQRAAPRLGGIQDGRRGANA